MGIIVGLVLEGRYGDKIRKGFGVGVFEVCGEFDKGLLLLFE